MSHFAYSCERCREFCGGYSYAVTSESDGERVLDMIVCYECYLDAAALGLATETIAVSAMAVH